MVYTITVHLYANDNADDIRKLKLKLIEASRVYSQDKETISWFVMQDIKDERAFTIVERYEQESVRSSILFFFNWLFIRRLDGNQGKKECCTDDLFLGDE